MSTLPDSDAVDVALFARLTDATLQALMPAGAFWDVSQGSVTQFVIVSQLAHEDQYMFGGVAFERFLYLVKAVEKITSATGNVKAAARRLHELLQCVTAAERVTARLTIPGYDHEHTKRVERVKHTEVDEVDADIRWQHRGGHYEVLVSPKPQ